MRALRSRFWSRQGRRGGDAFRVRRLPGVRRGSSLLAILGATALAATVAACGSSSSKNTSSAPSAGSGTSTSSGAAATGAPITVGVICSCSGAFGGNFLAAYQVYRSWVNTVNASGGVNGHPIQIVYEDDAATPGKSVTDAHQLVTQHVDAILDESILDESWASIVQAANIPVVGGNATEDPMYQNPDFYPEGTTNDQIIPAVAQTDKAAGATNIGFVYCAEAPSCAEGGPVLKAAAAKFGIADLYSGEISATAPNYTAQCVAMQQAHVQSVFIGDSSTEIERLAVNCSQQNFNPIYLLQGEGIGEDEVDAPSISTNLWAPYNDIPFWADVPVVKTMDAAINKYYPNLLKNTKYFTELAAEAWPSGLLLADAVKAGGLTASDTPSASEIIKGLESLKGDTLDGSAPPLTFAAGKPHSVNCYFLTHDVNGHSSLLDNGKAQCV